MLKYCRRSYLVVIWIERELCTNRSDRIRLTARFDENERCSTQVSPKRKLLVCKHVMRVVREFYSATNISAIPGFLLTCHTLSIGIANLQTEIYIVHKTVLFRIFPLATNKMFNISQPIVVTYCASRYHL